MTPSAAHLMLSDEVTSAVHTGDLLVWANTRSVERLYSFAASRDGLAVSEHRRSIR
jgi:hypothetical protein